MFEAVLFSAVNQILDIVFPINGITRRVRDLVTSLKLGFEDGHPRPMSGPGVGYRTVSDWSTFALLSQDQLPDYLLSKDLYENFLWQVPDYTKIS